MPVDLIASLSDDELRRLAKLLIPYLPESPSTEPPLRGWKQIARELGRTEESAKSLKHQLNGVVYYCGRTPLSDRQELRKWLREHGHMLRVP